MKKIIGLSVLVLFIVSLTGCMNNYLDEPTPSEQGSLSVADAYSSKENATAVIAGLLRQQRSIWSRYSGSRDASSLCSMLFARSVKGSDIQITNSWFLYDYQHEFREASYRRSYFSWGFPYMMIGRANLFLKGVEESTGINDADKPALYAQAKAFRGFYYFQLALEFNHAYKYKTDAIAPPVYTSIDVVGKPMGKLDDLYKQILSDLEYAFENISATRVDNSWIDKKVVAAMLANVYLSMENWSSAEEMAKIAYGGDVLDALHTISTYNPVGFNNYDDKEWLWSMSQTTSQSSYYFTAPHAFIHIGKGYNNAYINTTFASLFSENDRRKEAIVPTDPENIPKDDLRYFKTTKFIFEFNSSMPIYRTPEFILVAAESAARQGKTTEAQEILNKFKSTRYKDFVYENLTGEDLIEDILLERRKELYAENGVEWFDAKRLQRGIKRTGNHSVKVDLAPNDKRFIMKIPIDEINNNVNIDNSVNNDR